MEDVAIQVKRVSKNFALPHERAKSVKEAFINPFRSSMHKNVDVQHALKDISFTVKKGEFFGIVGRNGSGKSTLLKLLAGIYQPTKGSIVTKGKLVPFIELGVGFNPELTGRQNVFLNGALLGFSEKEVAAQYDDIVEFAELKDFMDQKLKNYSSGMQVRLAFSMAVRAKADILLIDEVLAVGDADFQRKCFEYFKQLKNNRVTVVFVSHDMNAVREYCDRALLIEKSKLVDIGETSGIAEQYQKLFMSQQGQSVGSEQGDDRWGDQKLVITNVAAEIDEHWLKITQTIKARVDSEPPIVGVRVRDASGKDITGTNTILEDTKLPSIHKGQVLKIEFKFPNVFADGKYTVDPAVLHNDGITVSDWWNRALYVNIQKKRHLPYMVDPGFLINYTIK